MLRTTKFGFFLAAACLLLCVPASAELTDGLTFYSPLDTTGAVDLIGGNDGALSGGVVVFDDATRGNVFDFSGSGSAKATFAGVPTAGTGSITISLWFNSLNANVADSGSQFIATHGNANGSAQEGWTMYLSSSSTYGDPQTRAHVDGEIVGTYYDRSADAADSNWHHMLMTIDNATGLMTSYFDGIGSGTDGNAGNWTAGGGGAASTVDFTPGDLGSDGEDLVFGVMYTYTHRSFSGRLDDVAIWDRVLTGTEIAAVYGGASLVAVPEPSSMLLILSALAGLLVLRRAK